MINKEQIDDKKKYEKNKSHSNMKLSIIFSILIILFTISIVSKEFQNDTFFTIPIGNYIIENGVSEEEQFTIHEGLKFTNSRWAFDVIVASIYNFCGFNGIYFFTVMMACIIGLTLFTVMVKRKCNIIISFLFTICAMYLSKDAFSARAQIISYLMFIIEIYLIENLLEKNKKKYAILLIAVSIIIANFHASVWPMYFILFLPYIAEYIYSKTKMVKFSKKLKVEKFDIKLLIITLIIAFFGGLCTPIGFAPYTDMINVMSGVSTSFIGELSRVALVESFGMFILLILFVVIISFNETKMKISDLCLFLGLYLMGLMAFRNTMFLYLIGSISLARTIDNLINQDNQLDEITENFSQSNKWIIAISICILTIIINNFLIIANEEYVNKEKYPVDATEYILQNVDIENMRIFNHFNFGSYLEFKAIPVFIDSRSGIYCAEFNETNILEDWLNTAKYASIHYQDTFEKYEITHVLLYKKELLNIYVSKDKNYKILYEDDNFCLYEKI